MFWFAANSYLVSLFNVEIVIVCCSSVCQAPTLGFGGRVEQSIAQ